MLWKRINRLCLRLCFASLIGSAGLSILTIWSDSASDKEIQWRSVGTLLVVFVASLGILVVNKAMSYTSYTRQ